MKQWRIEAIRKRNLKVGGFYFAPSTLKYFNNVMADFEVLQRDEHVFVHNKMNGVMHQFNTENGRLVYTRLTPEQFAAGMNVPLPLEETL